MKTLLIFIFLSAAFFNVLAQNGKNLAEKLGYSPDAKLLIVHADDMGLSQATNSAIIEAFQKGAITSGSVMVPCPWFPEIAEFAKNNTNYDVGVHLTLTSEWDSYLFGGVAPLSEIHNLLTPVGYFYPSVGEFAKHANAVEVEKELRAQIERAFAFGIKPTHFDNHMGSIMLSPEYYQILLKLGREYKTPVLIPANAIGAVSKQLLDELSRDAVVVDHLFMLNKASQPDKWGEQYLNFINGMQPGLNEIIVHLARDNDETRAIMINHPDFGAEWRQHDLDFVLSREFKNALEQNHIKLVTWRQIKEVQYPEK